VCEITEIEKQSEDTLAIVKEIPFIAIDALSTIYFLSAS